MVSSSPVFLTFKLDPSSWCYCHGVNTIDANQFNYSALSLSLVLHLSWIDELLYIQPYLHIHLFTILDVGVGAISSWDGQAEYFYCLQDFWIYVLETGNSTLIKLSLIWVKVMNYTILFLQIHLRALISKMFSAVIIKLCM